MFTLVNPKNNTRKEFKTLESAQKAFDKLSYNAQLLSYIINAVGEIV